MTWCHQATSHCLNQFWPRSILPYGVSRPQWEENNIWYSISCEIWTWFLYVCYGNIFSCNLFLLINLALLFRAVLLALGYFINTINLEPCRIIRPFSFPVHAPYSGIVKRTKLLWTFTPVVLYLEYYRKTWDGPETVWSLTWDPYTGQTISLYWDGTQLPLIPGQSATMILHMLDKKNDAWVTMKYGD